MQVNLKMAKIVTQEPELLQNLRSSIKRVSLTIPSMEEKCRKMRNALQKLSFQVIFRSPLKSEINLLDRIKCSNHSQDQDQVKSNLDLIFWEKITDLPML